MNRKDYNSQWNYLFKMFSAIILMVLSIGMAVYFGKLINETSDYEQVALAYNRTLFGVSIVSGLFSTISFLYYFSMLCGALENVENFNESDDDNIFLDKEKLKENDEKEIN